ncbi:MAG TPA: hypothetical protein VN461_11505 [Vicinamibacteria bacterium]|nr:hypothetical protein [Vicinamibacteria bacterium]
MPFVFVLLLAAAVPATAQTSVFVTVPDHGEEALTWCGAATGQMVVGGYPAGACTLLQADVWDGIQAHKVEGSWDTDPAGLKDAMMTLCPPAGGHWVVFSNANAPSLMHSVAFWMNTNHYPVAALLNTNTHNAIATHHEHWIAIKGIVTDLDPRTNPSVTLQYVLIVDQPLVFGDPPVERFLSGSQWYAEFGAVAKSGSAYNGNFVAVIEPPKIKGVAIAKLLPVVGPLIPIDRVTALAERAVQTDLSKVPSFPDLRNLKPQRPLLVNPQRGGYYIVPFARGEAPAELAVLINAYSGGFMEAARFKARPVLSDKDAIARALHFLGRDTAKQSAAVLAYREGSSPYLPFWRVTIDGQDLLVDAEGRVHQVGREK